MNARISGNRWSERGVGLVEVMVSMVIGMLMVLVIYQVFTINEAQKRTITSGSDAQGNASYGLFLLGQDVSVAGNAIASSIDAQSSLVPKLNVLRDCALVRPIPVLITDGGGPTAPDTITVIYGGSASLSTPVAFSPFPTATQTTTPYKVGNSPSPLVTAPLGFSAGDVIVAVQGGNCTLSTINAGGVTVDAAGFVTLTHTPVAGSPVLTYDVTIPPTPWVVNLGPAAALRRVVYSVDPACSAANATRCALRTQNLLPTAGPVSPVISDVVNVKAQYGLDTSGVPPGTTPPDGIVDAWQVATGATWSAANLPTQSQATWQQIRAVRIAIVTRSPQYEQDVVTPGPLTMFAGADAIADGATAVSMALTADQQHYRYKVLETVIPLRNAMWNSP